MEAERADALVPDLIIRALSGKWVPSRRHLVASPEELGKMMNVPTDVARRAQMAVSARRLAMEGRAQGIAGALNGWHDLEVEAARKTAYAGLQLRTAIEGLA